MTRRRASFTRLCTAMVIILTGMMITSAGSTLAATSPVKPVPQTPSITVTPGRVDIILDGTAPVQKRQIAIANNYDQPMRLNAEFQGINEAANLIVPYGKVSKDLEPLLKLSETDITIAAHSSGLVEVQLTDSPAIQAGGQYATLVLTPYADSTATNGNRKLSSVRSSISVGIYIVKQGTLAGPKLQVNAIDTQRSLLGLPTSLDISFSNNGNVHTVPRAVIKLLGNNGQTLISQGIANQESALLLPGKHLSSHVTLTTLSDDRLWHPQKLRIVSEYRPDGADTVQTFSRDVLYVPAIYSLLPLTAFGVLIWGYWRLTAKRRHADGQAQSADEPEADDPNATDIKNKPRKIAVIFKDDET